MIHLEQSKIDQHDFQSINVQISLLMAKPHGVNDIREKIASYAETIYGLRVLFSSVNPSEIVIDDVKAISTAVSMLSVAVHGLVETCKAAGMTAEKEMAVVLLDEIVTLCTIKENIYSKCGFFTSSSPR